MAVSDTYRHMACHTVVIFSVVDPSLTLTWLFFVTSVIHMGIGFNILNSLEPRYLRLNIITNDG